MKRMFLYFLLALSSVLCAHVHAQMPSVSVKGGKVTVAGARIPADWSIAPILEKLGSNYRKRDGYNITYTYDPYGIVLFEKKGNENGTGKLIEIQVHFGGVEPNNVTPTGNYTGNAMVEKLTVNAGLASQNMMASLKKYAQTESYTEHNFRMAYKGVYIYFLFNDNEQSLMKISIGPDKKS